MIVFSRTVLLAVVLAFSAACGDDPVSPVAPSGLLAPQLAAGAVSAGSGGPSSSLQLLPETSTVPGAVQNLGYTVYDTTVVLAWAPPAGDADALFPVARYAIDRNGSRIATPSASTCSSSQCTYSETGLTVGTHDYNVSGVNSLSESGPTTALTVVVASRAPDAVRDLGAVVAPDTTNATISWKPPLFGGFVDPSVTSYEVVRDYGAQTTTQAATSCTGSGTAATCSLTSDGLATGQHMFLVTAVNSFGSGPGSETTVDIADPNPPVVAVPARVRRLRSRQSTQNQNVTVTWRVPLVDHSADTSVTSYTVIRDDTWSSSFDASGCTGFSASTSCSIRYTALSTGRHTFSVAAVNSAGTGRARTTARRVRTPR